MSVFSNMILSSIKQVIAEYFKYNITNRTYIVPLHGAPVIYDFVNELKKKTDPTDIGIVNAEKVSSFWSDFDQHFQSLADNTKAFLTDYVVELKWRDKIEKSSVYKIRIYCREKRKLVFTASFTSLPSLN